MHTPGTLVLRSSDQNAQDESGDPLVRSRAGLLSQGKRLTRHPPRRVAGLAASRVAAAPSDPFPTSSPPHPHADATSPRRRRPRPLTPGEAREAREGRNGGTRGREAEAEGEASALTRASERRSVRAPRRDLCRLTRRHASPISLSSHRKRSLLTDGHPGHPSSGDRLARPVRAGTHLERRSRIFARTPCRPTLRNPSHKSHLCESEIRGTTRRGRGQRRQTLTWRAGGVGAS